MRKSLSTSFIWVAVWGLIILVILRQASVASAQEPSPVSNVEIVLVLDDSGSMQQNDPQNLRVVAARLLVSLLDVGDRVAVIRFSDKSETLAELTTIQDKGSKASILGKLRGFKSAGSTDIRAAMVQTGKVLSQPSSQSWKRFVVFLTDGHAEWKLQPSVREMAEYTEETLDIARKFAAPVASIALGGDADKRFLEALARVTQGEYFEANSALDLPAIYLKVLSFVQDRTIIGPGQISAPRVFDISVNRYAQRIAFIVVKEETVSVAFLPPGSDTPLDKTGPMVTAYVDPRFEVVIPSDALPGGCRVRLGGRGTAHLQAILVST